MKATDGTLGFVDMLADACGKVRASPCGMISYSKDGEWGGYQLRQRKDGLWRYERWNRIQGNTTGRVVVVRPPEGLKIADEADMETLYTDVLTKAEFLILMGTEVRCVRRGYLVS